MSKNKSLYMYIYIYIYRLNYIYMHIYIYIYLYIYACVCMSVCAHRMCMCVCVSDSLWHHSPTAQAKSVLPVQSLLSNPDGLALRFCTKVSPVTKSEWETFEGEWVKPPEYVFVLGSPGLTRTTTLIYQLSRYLLLCTAFFCSTLLGPFDVARALKRPNLSGRLSRASGSWARHARLTLLCTASSVQPYPVLFVRSGLWKDQIRVRDFRGRVGFGRAHARAAGGGGWLSNAWCVG